ncbi:MAG TPA: hypothetical protein VGO93_23715 [Candidatus Xenobia bacterium]|jgi:hypothetical protein
MVAALALRWNTILVPKTIVLESGGELRLDGYNRDEKIAVEAWAHHGRSKPAQRHKIANDMLKLLMVRRLLGDGWRLVLLFADPEAHHFLEGRSWRAKMVSLFGFQIEEVDIPAEVHARVRAAQKRQAPATGLPFTP